MDNPSSSLIESSTLQFSKRRLFTLVVALFVLVALAPSEALAKRPDTWVKDEIIVHFQKGVSRGRGKGIYQSLGGAEVDENPGLNAHLIRVAPQALDAVERALAKRTEVKFVEKNYLLEPEFIPNDPEYSNQWHLPKIDAPAAWNTTVGDPNVIIAILDSGVDCSHPDLAAKCISGWNFYDNNGDTTDVYGHGTKVAGAATAMGNNGTGVAGVGLQNDLMPIRVTNLQGSGTVWAITQGLTWAVDNGASVMNLSFEGIADVASIRNAADYVVSQGGVVVAASGNCGCANSTGDSPSIISVSSTTSSDALSSFSSTGNYVDISAPGSSIRTTLNGGSYGPASGTSFSSPIVAGVAGLILSVDPTLTPNEVEGILETSSVDLGANGYDTSYGHGRVDAAAAVSMALSGEGPVPDPDPVNFAPNAVMSAQPTSGTVPLEVTFDGTGSNDSDGNIVSYDWNFGDGNTGSGPTISHTYFTEGTFTATLTVTDDLGAQSSQTVAIVVEPEDQSIAAPSNLGAAVSGSTVTLLWADNSHNEEGLYIERGTKRRGRINYSNAGQVSANVTTFSESLSSGTYRYRVRAFNLSTGETSDYSGSIEVAVGSTGGKGKGKKGR